MDQEELAQHTGEQQLAGMTQENSSKAAQYYLQEQEKSLADSQLEVDNIKSEIYHLLRQDKLGEIVAGSGKLEWVSLTKRINRVLSDEGVDRFMQVIHFYINKNTLLSNFSEPEIKRLMLKFVREINDLILLKYQILFSEPTFEECKEIILEKIENKKKMKIFSSEILGIKIDSIKIEKELLFEAEKNLEKEMNQIKKDQRKEKLRDYGLIIAQLEIIVLSTLNRAYRGEERGSLRRHMNVTEVIDSKSSTPIQKEGGFMGWGRR